MPTSRATTASGFDRFELHPDLARAVHNAGFSEPRPIQADTIPAALEGTDVLGLAQTGTGKTAAFAIPCLEYLLTEPGRGPRVLVIAPTRELVTQIDEEFRRLASKTSIRTMTIYGGVSEKPQISKLKRHPDVISACPGRLLDLLRQGHVDLDRIETLILDEADHMFDMGFLPDIRRILERLPRERQNLLFAATMPGAIRKLAEEILVDPFISEIDHTVPAKTIEHALYPVREKRKIEMLRHFLCQDDFKSAIVFTRTKRRARQLAQKLEQDGHRAVALQGNMSQNARDRAMGGFRRREFDILVATDVAARGIDVEGISHVINLDIPNTAETYTHRIGRTGRSEREGKAYTFITEEDGEMIAAIEKMIGKSLEVHSVPGFEAAPVARKSAPASRGSASRKRRRRGTGRPSEKARLPAKKRPVPEKKRPQSVKKQGPPPQKRAPVSGTAEAAGKRSRSRSRRARRKNAAARARRG